jgi:hypothetical protein
MLSTRATVAGAVPRSSVTLRSCCSIHSPRLSLQSAPGLRQELSFERDSRRVAASAQFLEFDFPVATPRRMLRRTRRRVGPALGSCAFGLQLSSVSALIAGAGDVLLSAPSLSSAGGGPIERRLRQLLASWAATTGQPMCSIATGRTPASSALAWGAAISAAATVALLARHAMSGPAFIGDSAFEETVGIGIASAVVAILLARPHHQPARAGERSRIQSSLRRTPNCWSHSRTLARWVLWPEATSSTVPCP